MALDAAHRSSIYEKLRPILGDEDANVLMSEFPSVEAEELVTKDFLRAELAITRGDLRGEMAELRAEMGELRTELRTEMAGLRTELRTEMAGLRTELRTEMAGLRTEVGGQIDDLRGEMGELRLSLATLENRLTVRLGSAIAATAALLTTIALVQ